MKEGKFTALDQFTLETIGSSIAAYREEAWPMTSTMDVRLAVFEAKVLNLQPSQTFVREELSKEAIRIAAHARQAYGDGQIDATVADYANTAALLDPRGFDEAQRERKHVGFTYDEAKVVITPADQRVIETPKPIVPVRDQEARSDASMATLDAEKPLGGIRAQALAQMTQAASDPKLSGLIADRLELDLDERRLAARYGRDAVDAATILQATLEKNSRER